MKKIFNLELLESVEIVNEKQYKSLEWRDEKKFMWYKEPAGYYDKDWYSVFQEENLKSGIYPKHKHCSLEGIKFLIKNKKVYFKPYVELTFISGQKIVKNFETYVEAKTWGVSQASKGIKIQLNIEN